MADKVSIENVNHPGSTTQVDAIKYQSVRDALLMVLPATDGLTQSEMIERMKATLPDALFPGGAKAGWWTKAVQLDLEAKGLVVRTASKPTRWRRR